MSDDNSIEGISCPAVSECYFRNDRKWVIANRESDFRIQLDQNILWRDYDSPDLIEILQFHDRHWRNSNVANLYQGERLL